MLVPLSKYLQLNSRANRGLAQSALVHSTHYEKLAQTEVITWHKIDMI